MNRRGRKHSRVDVASVSHVLQLFEAETETEATDRALNFVISEHRRNQRALSANDELLASGIPLRDVYGVTTGTRNRKRTTTA